MSPERHGRYFSYAGVLEKQGPRSGARFRSGARWTMVRAFTAWGGTVRHAAFALGIALAGAPLPSCGSDVEASPTAPSRAGGSEPAVAKPTPDVAFPDHPARGTLRGRPFVPDRAILDEGILTLRSGEEFFADAKVMLFLFLEDDSIVPEGRRFEVDCEGSWGRGVPHVHTARRVPGERLPEHESTTCGYRL
ncbi:MAG: hypothetical protein GWN85_12070, partial [Gemmatimonadetes bacterium]|nr:hypothetical protein [Gemmatimonadota bacterium]